MGFKRALADFVEQVIGARIVGPDNKIGTTRSSSRCHRVLFGRSRDARSIMPLNS